MCVFMYLCNINKYLQRVLCPLNCIIIMSMSFVEKQKQTQLTERRVVVHTVNMAYQYVAAVNANSRLKFTTSGARMQHICCFCGACSGLLAFCVSGIY